MALTDFEEACAQAFNSEPPTRRPGPSDILYHYTGPEGFQAILQSQRLHATHIRFFKDSREVEHGRDLLLRVLADEFADWTGGDRAAFQEELLVHSQMHPGMLPSVFVASFTEKPDDEFHWRTFADSGLGYALGLDADSLAMGFRPEGASWVQTAFLRPVTYAAAEQESHLRRLVTKAHNVLAQAGPPDNEVERRQRFGTLAHSMAWPILELLCTFKTETYSREREWRLLATAGPHISQPGLGGMTKTSRGQLVKFESLRFYPGRPGPAARLPIRRVVTGPSLRAQEHQALTADLLREAGFRSAPDRHLAQLRDVMPERFGPSIVAIAASALQVDT